MAGRKSNIKQFQNITNGDMSQASVISSVTDIQFLDNIGIQLNWTGAPVGNFAIQVSADHNQDMNGNVVVAGNWSPILVTYWTGSASATGVSIPTTVGSPIYVDLNQLSSPYIRVVYTRTSGTGTLNSFITAKEV